MKKNNLALLFFLCLFFTSCVSSHHERYNVEKINYMEETEEHANSLKLKGGIIPPTLKILQTEAPKSGYKSEITLHAAKGESETTQILLYLPQSKTQESLQDLQYSFSNLTGPDGFSITPETGIVAYVPVKKPMWVSFHKKGLYPDPICPNNKNFSIKAGNSQALWYDVLVPQNAPKGVYTGEVKIKQGEKTLLTYPVNLTVYDVVLPKTSNLETVFIFQKYFSDDYYPNWTEEMAEDLPHLTIKFRMSSPINLKLQKFSTMDENGKLSIDFSEFDKKVEYWKGLGVNTFKLSDLDLGLKIPEKDRDYWEKYMQIVDNHLVEKGWTEDFYLYGFDEPTTDKLKDVQELCDWYHKFGPHFNIIFTMGFTSSGPAWMKDYVDIWVPHIHQYDKDFFASEQAKGNNLWIYTCMQTFMMRYPDSWKIDWYGTSHRALGTWLFKHNADGYLYWGLDYWSVNPWEDTESFILTNGDGCLFYPVPQELQSSIPAGKVAHYPSTRLYMTRDGFEDYDLLTILKEKTKTLSPNTKIGKEVQKILSCINLIPTEEVFETDDEAYIQTHKRILEILEELK